MFMVANTRRRGLRLYIHPTQALLCPQLP